MSLSRSLRGIFLVVVLCIAGLPAMAQDVDDDTKLSKAVVTSTVVLTTTQQQEIDEYVTYSAGKLIDGADYEVPAARARLHQPFNDPSATDIFKGRYSISICRRLAGAVSEQQRVVTRLNAMILLRSVGAKGVEDLIRPGLSDGNPSVRYLASKAAAGDGKRPELELGQKKALLGALTRAFRNETDPLVAGQVLLGYVGLLDLPDAQQALLEGL